jgi:excisionase family DNA binding protein
MSDVLVSISEAARDLKVSSRTVSQMIDDGRLAGTRTPLGRLAFKSDVARLAHEREKLPRLQGTRAVRQW